MSNCAIEPHPSRDGRMLYTLVVEGGVVVIVVVRQQHEIADNHQPSGEGNEVGSHPPWDKLSITVGRQSHTVHMYICTRSTHSIYTHKYIYSVYYIYYNTYV